MYLELVLHSLEIQLFPPPLPVFWVEDFFLFRPGLVVYVAGPFNATISFSVLSSGRLFPSPLLISSG